MKEAPQSPYPKLIFRETFNDEQAVRKNGGVPTAITFANGVGSFGGMSKIIYPRNNDSNIKSFEFRFKRTDTTRDYILGNISYPYLSMRFGANQAMYRWSTTSYQYFNVTDAGYVDGKLHHCVLIPDYSNITNSKLYLDGVSMTKGTGAMVSAFVPGTTLEVGNSYIGDMDLFNCYGNILTDSEVANLYKGNWNTELSGMGGEAKGNIIPSLNFTSGWSGTGTTIVDEDTFSSAATGNVAKSLGMIIGKKYQVYLDIITSSSSCRFQNNIGSENYKTAITTGVYNFTLIASSAGIGFFNDSDGITTITTLSIQELNPLTLLDFDSTGGVIRDRTGKNTLTSTAVTATKSGASFNGTTSIIDTGSDFIGTKAITVMGWIKAYSLGESNIGSIIRNNKFILRLNTPNILYCFSDGSTAGDSGAITFNQFVFFSVTRTPAGLVNFYLGSKTTAPVASGTNKNTGTPAAGTSNIVIGNDVTTGNTFNGLIPKLKVVEGILSLEDITREWSSSLTEIN